MLVRRWSSSTREAAAERLEQVVEPLGAGLRERRPGAHASSSGWRGFESSSRERSALANACLNVRPIAIASPTDFMWVVRSASAPGNFSNANRGHLTTQ